jgi:hypothetical protein
MSPEPMETELAAEPLLAGRYAHVRELGRGAKGRVLLVEDRVEGGLVAVKIVSAEDAERLRWELALLASIAHPGLARVRELVSVREPIGAPFRLEPGAAALVQEHVDGANAGERVAALATDEERLRFVVTVGISIARALAAIHAHGLVHGDVKPANVVVPDDASLAKLVDLGLARAPGVSATLSGTPAYLAPEAWLGERSIATDLYALGATLHALATGRTAFDTEGSTFASMERALVARPNAAELPSATPLALRRLIADLLAEAPSARPASAREDALRLAALASEVDAVVPAGDAISALPTGVERAARAALRPMVGRRDAHTALLERLRERGVITVGGPPGAGKSRLIREAVRALQTDVARSSGRVPTYAIAIDRVPRMRHDAVVHVPEALADGALALVEAAAVEGVELRVVVEGREGEIELGPLDDASLSRLLADLLELDPSPALLAAARAASGALPGRLCRLIAEGLERGIDPSRPAALEELGRSADGAKVPPSARPLAQLLAVAGGALDAEPAAKLCHGAAEQALTLRSMGLADEVRGTIALRPDVRASIAAGMRDHERRTIAKRLATVPLGERAFAHVHAALGDRAAAERAFLAAIAIDRAAGDPERAASTGAEALITIDSIALRLARPTRSVRARVSPTRSRSSSRRPSPTPSPRAPSSTG